MKVFKWEQEDLDEKKKLVFICDTPLVIEEHLIKAPTDPNYIWIPVTGITTLRDMIGPLARKSMRVWLVYHREAKRNYMTLEIGGGCEAGAEEVDRIYIPDFDNEEKKIVRKLIKDLTATAKAAAAQDTDVDTVPPNSEEPAELLEWEIPDNIVSIFSGKKQQ